MTVVIIPFNRLMVYEVTIFATSAAGLVIDFQQQASLDMSVLATKIEEAKIEVSSGFVHFHAHFAPACMYPLLFPAHHQKFYPLLPYIISCPWKLQWTYGPTLLPWSYHLHTSHHCWNPFFSFEIAYVHCIRHRL